MRYINTWLSQFPMNIWVLAVTFSLVMTGISLLLFIGGLIGADLASKIQWATLPVTAFVVGSACMAIPAAMLLKKFNRKRGSYIGLSISLLSALLGVLAVNKESFTLLLACGLFIGLATPFYQQFRFAAIESLKDKNNAGPVLSILMLFNIGGAILGPELGVFGKDLIPKAAPYTGSFVLFGGLVIIAMGVFSLFKNPTIDAPLETQESRSLIKIVAQPIFLVALFAAACGYGVMSYLMTSTPLSMHEHHGYSLKDAKWVIQSHLVAMFLPSLFTGYLIKHLGMGRMMFVGGALYFLVVAVAFSGEAVIHYWWALVLLGVGWNLLFISGTALLPHAYRSSERFKAQAINDFLIFCMQGLASLSAAWVLFNYGWHVQVLTTLPFIIVVVLGAIYCLKILKK